MISSTRIRKPISRPLRASWKIPLLSEQVLPLLKGFQPESMDDKWAIWSEGPDERGRCKVLMCRSWTGHRIFEVEVSLKKLERGDGRRGNRDIGGWITGLVWEENKDVARVESERDAKSIVRSVCKVFLGVELKNAEG
jgi:hypothetical protein